MAYHTFAASEYDPESPLTTSFFSNLIGNFAGLAANDSGAPSIVDAALALKYDGIYLDGDTAVNASACTLDQNIDTTYENFYIVLSNIYPATNASYMLMELSDDGGSTWKTSGYYEAMIGAAASGTSPGTETSTTATALHPFGTTSPMNNTSTRRATSVIHINNAADSVINKVTWFSAWFTSSSSYAYTTGMGAYNTGALAIDAIRFRQSSGNIYCTARIYGHRNS